MKQWPREHKNYFAEYRDQPDKQAAALQAAVQSRQFEIDLYWKRTTYFWTLSAATLAGYFALRSRDNHAGLQFSTFCVACLGFVIAFAWFFVNKGSKFWQENWENHVAVLSPPSVGSLYKKVLRRPPLEARLKSRFGDISCFEKFRRAPFVMDNLVTKPGSYSVSKINQWVSLYVVCFWCILILASAPDKYRVQIAPFFHYRYEIAGIFTALLALCMFIWGNTHLGNHEPEVKYMESEISN